MQPDAKASASAPRRRLLTAGVPSSLIVSVLLCSVLLVLPDCKLLSSPSPREGDPCAITPDATPTTCSADHTKLLLCQHGKLTVARTCKGPQKCSVSVSDNTPHCDDTLGAPGTPCIPETGANAAANYGCSTDRQQELVCDPATRKLQVWNACRGKDGCSLEGDTVRCDQSLARTGDPCHPADARACDETGVTELQCSPQFAWTTQRECKLAGCEVKSNAVFCE